MVGEDTWQREKQQPSDDKREREREEGERGRRKDREQSTPSSHTALTRLSA